MNDFEKRDVAGSEKLYRMKYNRLSACISKLKDHLLDKNWYIADAVDGTTACEIITDEICERYRNVNDETNKALHKFIEEQLKKIKKM